MASSPRSFVACLADYQGRTEERLRAFESGLSGYGQALQEHKASQDAQNSLISKLICTIGDSRKIEHSLGVQYREDGDRFLRPQLPPGLQGQVQGHQALEDRPQGTQGFLKYWRARESGMPSSSPPGPPTTLTQGEQEASPLRSLCAQGGSGTLPLQEEESTPAVLADSEPTHRLDARILQLESRIQDLLRAQGQRYPSPQDARQVLDERKFRRLDKFAGKLKDWGVVLHLQGCAQERFRRLRPDHRVG